MNLLENTPKREKALEHFTTFNHSPDFSEAK